MKNSIPGKIEKFLETGKIEFEAGRMMHFYPDYLVAKVWADVKKKLGVTAGIISDSQKNHTRFYAVYSSEKTFIELIRKIEKDRSFLSKLEKIIEEVSKKIVRMLKVTDFRKFNQDELARFAAEYYRSCEKLYEVSMISRCVDRGLNPLLQAKIKSRKDKEKILRLTSVTRRPSHSLRENLEILKLAKFFKDNSVSLSSEIAVDKINRIRNSVRWITSGNFKEKAKTFRDYQKEISLLLKKDVGGEIIKIEAERKGALGEKEKIMKSLDARARKLMEMVSRTAGIKDDFKFRINEVLFHSDSLFDEISRRTKKSQDVLRSLSPREMNNLISSKKFPHNRIKKRSKEYILLGYDSKIIELAGREADRFRRKYLELEKGEKQELKGRVASVGQGKGRAKIVLGSHEFSKLKKGDVLVVVNTTPDFVPVMKKASAIVAEEGGLTAHVSIVSREFKIPAVVGVKNVTKLIKNGDLVEVDAKRGVVRILKRT